MFCGVTCLVGRDLWPPKQEFWSYSKGRGIQMGAHQEGRKEPIHAFTESFPRLNNRNQPIWFPSVTTLAKANQNVTCKLSCHSLISAHIPPVIVLSWKELRRQRSKHVPDFTWRWSTVADGYNITVNPRWIYDPTADETGTEVGCSWSLADDGISDGNFNIQHDS